MTRDLLQTPSRRSKRFQPLATPSAVRTGELDCTWEGEPIHTRPVLKHLDYLPDELDTFEDVVEQDDNETQAVFYNAFSILTQKGRLYKGQKRSKSWQTSQLQQSYRIGDTVLVQTDTLYGVTRPPSVAVIVSMWEIRQKLIGDEDDQQGIKVKLRVHWFLRPSELASIRAKREHAANEIYYSLDSSEVLVPEAIMSHCSVSIPKPLSIGNVKYPPPQTPTKQSPSKRGFVYEDDLPHSGTETFSCHLAVDSRRGLFFDFNWKNHRDNALKESIRPDQIHAPHWGDGASWNVVEAGKRKKRSTKKPKIDPDSGIVSESDVTGTSYQLSDQEQEDNSGNDSDSKITDTESDEDILPVPKTPSKNRKRKRLETRSPSKATPRKPRQSTTYVHPTPHSKARSRLRIPATPSRKRQPFQIRPQNSGLGGQQNLSHLPDDAWLRAMHVLHVGSRPDALPCRESEYAKVLRSVGELLEEGSGGCVYISGVPGTGKTATVHTVVRELKRMAECNEINPFTYVEINGLKIPEPSAAYSLLWEAVSGHDAAKRGHLRISSKESLKALTRYFSNGGARGPAGHACVVLMDELDQLMTTKQDVVYNFFNWPTLVSSKLVVIAVANTMDLPERVMTGRVRSRLGMVRINFQPYTTAQLQEIIQSRLASAMDGMTGDEATKEVLGVDVIKYAAMKVSSLSGDARRVLDACRRTVELVQSKRKTARMADVKEVFQVIQNSPTAAYLRECSFHERMMLTTLIKCIKREGVDEIKWGEVQHQHLIYMSVLPCDEEPTRKPSATELSVVLDSLAASRAVLVEDGLAVSRKPESERKVLLNLDMGEVERVLSEVGGQRWRNVLCN